jgi:acetyl-CoA C-acetyltransferase
VDVDPPVVIAARRTPIGTAGRSLARLDVAGLAGPVLAALVDDLAGLLSPDRRTWPADRIGSGPGDAAVDDVVLGNCCGPGGDVARICALAAGLGVEVPGVSVDRQCGSGLEAVRLAAALVGSGSAEVVLAGGVESASTAPWRLARPCGALEPPRPYTRAPFAPAGFPDPEMGEAAELVAQRCQVSRDRQDRYAVRSHRRAVAAREAGLFDAELVPVGGVPSDERPRAELDEQTLGRFRAAFAAGGSVTAGNSCGINDGAAAVAVVSERVRARAAVPGLRILAGSVVGVDPELPGLGPVPAVRNLLARTGIEPDRIGVWEITEAFAAQLLACTDALGLDPLGRDAERVCPQGGAIALGHPWGASGALLLVRLFATMVRQPDGPRYGIASCPIGGGQGIALLVERVG